jgi:uncharacterized protein YdhG (YjbR/CyaY superfamily)
VRHFYDSQQKTEIIRTGANKMKKAETAPQTAAKSSTGFSADERAAMKERARELKAEERNSKDREAGLKDLLDKVAEMPEPDRSMATKIHEIVQSSAPHLMPKTWYGMPAYANKDGKVVCFFKAASKFGVRYAELGFNEPATLDDGAMWPTVFAIIALGEAEEARITALVKKATQ